jgi:hypothetical protein
MTNIAACIALNLSIWTLKLQWIHDTCYGQGQRGYMACPWFAIGGITVWHFKQVGGVDEHSHPCKGEQTAR